MRIGIDARMISMSGIGTYLRNLLEGLGRLDTDNEYVLLVRRADRERLPAPGENFSLAEAEAAPYTLAEQIGVMRAVGRLRLDLIHHPHYFAPAFGGTPMVATIHDLIHQLFPELCPSPIHWRVSWAMIRRTARRARLLLAVSEHTRRDILAHLGMPPEKVRRIYNALPPGWGEGGAPPLPDEVSALGGAPFFLYVGNHKRHKNLPLLLEAFAGLRARAPEARLVLTGGREDLEPELARRRLGGEVVFLGEVPHAALEGIYRAARALVFPSLYEGFGYPPVEAMGCGTPPIVSDAAALPEVVGEAGLVVSANDADALRGAMARLLEDDALRAALAAKGRERARAFSWRALAEGTLRAYRDALRGAPTAAAAGRGA